MMAHDVGISRKIDQHSLSIIEAVTPAERSYAKQVSAGGMTCFGDLRWDCSSWS